ncbi:hypothetical protein Plo01_14040 [Planobispora longispora]|uniref:N-acetyltransferase domain-containing protein n=1 Tax=Planobispora longispora TaxID=28887 RepID=A0A8J3W415_9ACTN|nr:hypothetical protein Plo01_14040 [Planobispora longispora]
MNAAGARLLGPALTSALGEVSAARCRMYVLADLGGPAEAPPLAAALVQTGRTAPLARLRALAVAAPYRARGLGRRLLGDLLTELRADGIRRVHYLATPGDDGMRALLRAAEFTPVAVAAEETRDTSWTYQYDMGSFDSPAIIWFGREL